jgi:thiol-disulfide isomerase/thioredoxin
MRVSRNLVLLFCGIVSPLLALVLYSLVYGTLTQASTDREKDWLFRLSVSTLAMAVPFFATVAIALWKRRGRTLSLAGKIGLALATLSLGLAWKPVNDGVLRSKQVRNLAMRDVAAPPFDTVDLQGTPERLSDQTGKVVIVNIWATWCAPCRAEMPKLDRLYREQKDKGLVVFGLSDEDVNVQKKFLQLVPVTYPLLTVQGHIPALYRDIARYPAIFLIDRSGRLQPAPSPDQPFDKLQSEVDALLNSRS